MAKKIFYFKEMLERFDKINAVCADQALAFNDAVINDIWSGYFWQIAVGW